MKLRKRTYGLIAAGGVLVAVGAVVVSAQPIARWVVATKLLPRVEQRLGCPVKVGHVSVGLNQAVLTDIDICPTRSKSGPSLIHVPRVTGQIGIWDLLRGRWAGSTVRIHDFSVGLVREKDGTDNFSHILQARKSGRLPGRQKPRNRLRDGFKMVTVVVEAGRVSLDDRRLGVSVSAAQAEARIVAGVPERIVLRNTSIDLSRFETNISFAEIHFSGQSAAAPSTVQLRNGKAIFPLAFALSQVDGEIDLRDWQKGGRLRVDVSGSYEDAPAKLWSASGWLQPFDRRGELQLKADTFPLQRIAAILRDTPVIRPDKSNLGGELKITLADDVVEVSAALEANDVNIFHPMLARQPIENCSGALSGEARFDMATGQVIVDALTVRYQDVTAEVAGEGAQLNGEEPQLLLRAKIAPITCQQVLDAIPKSFAPKLAGFEVEGDFSARMTLNVNYAQVDDASISGKIALDDCEVTAAPKEIDAARFQQSFKHRVEAAPGQFITFTVGPENPDYVAFSQASPHAINALMTTEDAKFFRHKGFAPSQFSVALARNLKNGGFRLGASTISMQMVKNVILSQEKTISRKFQELFLTWYLERALRKDRIMEIYMNIVEFGPGIYGIGAAAQHYFGKTAVNITPREGAFLATLLPSPRRRYVEYCRGKLSPKWKRYVGRILKRMYKRGRLFEDEYQDAIKGELVFSRELGILSAAKCIEQVDALNEAWEEEYRRRLTVAVTEAAPHQLGKYVVEPKPEPSEDSGNAL